MLTRDERLGCNLPAHSRGTTRIATLPTADAEGCSHSLRYVGRGPADLVIAMRCSIQPAAQRGDSHARAYCLAPNGSSLKAHVAATSLVNATKTS